MWHGTTLYRATLLVIGLVFTLLSACTPRLAPRGDELRTPVLTESRFVTTDGQSLPLRRWLPTQNDEVRSGNESGGTPVPQAGINGVILALHGFNDYSNAFDSSGRILSALGLAVYAYDQRGFGAAPHRGLWAGSEILTGDLAAASRALRQLHPGKPLYLLGESMGGAVILAAYGSADPPDADGIILSAPAVWARSTMPWHQRAALWLGAHTIPWAKFSGSGLKIQASDNVAMLRELGRDPLVIKESRVDTIHGLVDLMDQAMAAAPVMDLPALLLYGEKDEIIPREPTLQLWSNLPERENADQRLALYSNGWHMLLRDLDAAVVLADIVHWTEDRAANTSSPLSSGAEQLAGEALKDFRGSPLGDSLDRSVVPVTGGS